VMCVEGVDLEFVCEFARVDWVRDADRGKLMGSDHVLQVHRCHCLPRNSTQQQATTSCNKLQQTPAVAQKSKCKRASKQAGNSTETGPETERTSVRKRRDGEAGEEEQSERVDQGMPAHTAHYG
jgi:hypothetical protein